jgi:hypothetical protein
MARKRRKGEQGDEDDKRSKKLKLTLPQDTNIELLPAKALVPEHNENPAQVPLLPCPRLTSPDWVTNQEDDQQEAKKARKVHCKNIVSFSSSLSK